MRAALLVAAALAVSPLATPRALVWDDVAPPVQRLLGERGIDRASFATDLARVRARNQQRVREGDLDHLISYALQSSTFTDLPPIEPALSAREFAERASIPRTARARLDALASAIEKGRVDARLAYFRDIVSRERPARTPIQPFLSQQYARAMRFLYDKEFVAAGRGANTTDATGRLYQQRGLSTDTSVEAGYAVYLGLATLRRLEPQRRIRRVLVVGPGLDLAPRTGLVEAGDPQSYQPFAVVDALLALGLAGRDTLRVQTLDINPRVTGWLTRARGTPPRLSLVSSIAEREGVRFTDDYRDYFAAIGRAIGQEQRRPGVTPAHLAKSIQVAPGIAGVIDATTMDIVVDRLDERFDLILITNVFPYLPDADLLLAMTNVAHMLAPAGVLLHNEARPLMAEATLALDLPLLHSRSAVIATTGDPRAPLYDAVWMHRARD